MDAKRRKEILEALSHHQRKGALEIGADAFANAANESDRGLVVILGSHLEDMLVEEILSRFPEDTRSQARELVKTGGPLSAWGQQIKFARAFGIIDEDDAKLLEVVKSIRNACAHSRIPIDFNTPALRDALTLIFGPRILDFAHTAPAKHLVRGFFIRAMAYMWGRIEGSEEKRDADGLILLAREFVERRLKASPQKRQPQPSKAKSPKGPKTKAPRRPPQSSRP